ncbi:MAG: (2Fe-2S) ferredoxin domain-containing protein, partial [Okeania sp. SIO2D1]|nr:(2Fe-2S) ferredoxin domain-containing protein [Okeania sp. SIO2D1]
MSKDSTSTSITVLVCQGRTCSSSGSDQVLAAFQEKSPLGMNIIAGSCLGQCGNGPMVLILPEQTWYSK